MTDFYIVEREVVKVRGTQTFIVEAESHEEAARKVVAGLGKLDDEYIDVHELSTSCNVYLPDDKRGTVVDL